MLKSVDELTIDHWALILRDAHVLYNTAEDRSDLGGLSNSVAEEAWLGGWAILHRAYGEWYEAQHAKPE